MCLQRLEFPINKAAVTADDPEEVTIKLEVWDKNSIAKDSLIGFIECRLSELTRAQGEQRLDLQTAESLKAAQTSRVAGSAVGQLAINLRLVTKAQQAEDAQLALRPKTLHVFMQKCIDLKDVDGGLAGKSDPFVKLIVQQMTGERQEQQSTTKENTLAPVFDESFQFNVSEAQVLPGGRQEGELIMELWDHNDVTTDTLIGSARLPLGEARESASHAKDLLSIESQGDKQTSRKFAGVVHFEVSDHPKREAKPAAVQAAAPEAAAAEDASLEEQKEVLSVTVASCSNLKDLETFSTSDPYVAVTLRQTDSTTQQFKTEEVDGELNPTYNKVFEFASNVAQRTAGNKQEATLELVVWDKNTVSDDVMGKYSVTLSKLKSGENQTIKLLGEKDEDGEFGTITISVSWKK